MHGHHDNTREELSETAEMFGVTIADLEMPCEAMFSAGLDKLCRVRKAAVRLMHLRHARHIALLRQNTADEEVIADREDEFKAEEDDQLRKPLWKKISGLPESELLPQYPRERRRALTILVNMIARLVRWELEHGESDEVALKNSFSQMYAATEETAPSLLVPLEKTVHWDPLQGICAALGLVRIALTRFAKEAVGLSAHEIVDKLRAKKVKARLKDLLFLQLREILLAEFGNDWKDVQKLSPRDLWNKLRATRREPEFHRTQHAQQLGFPNYPRYFHACLNEHHQAPSQIEMDLIKEFLVLCAEQQGSGDRGQGSEATVAAVGSDAALPSGAGVSPVSAVGNSPLAGEGSGAMAESAGSTTARRSSTSIKLPITDPQQVQKNTTNQSETKVG